jgi:hypothetical protein
MREESRDEQQQEEEEEFGRVSDTSIIQGESAPQTALHIQEDVRENLENLMHHPKSRGDFMMSFGSLFMLGGLN